MSTTAHIYIYIYIYPVSELLWNQLVSTHAVVHACCAVCVDLASSQDSCIETRAMQIQYYLISRACEMLIKDIDLIQSDCMVTRVRQTYLSWHSVCTESHKKRPVITSLLAQSGRARAMQAGDVMPLSPKSLWRSPNPNPLVAVSEQWGQLPWELAPGGLGTHQLL